MPSMSPKPLPVQPNSVRVWHGFRAPDLSYEEFANLLGTVFIPTGTLLQPRAGLCAFLPTMTRQTDKPEEVPDQTALMWWTTEQQHDLAPRCQAVRAYQALHFAYDETRSKSRPPVPFEGSAAAGQSYHLFTQEADWMLGTVRHFVGGPREAGPGWLDAVGRWASDYVASEPGAVDGALLDVADGYVAFWEHYPDADAPPSPALDQLAELATPSLSKAAEPIAPGGGLWDEWPGWPDLGEEDCWNIQLDRPDPPPRWSP
jgi:hypothetical protein